MSRMRSHFWILLVALSGVGPIDAIASAQAVSAWAHRGPDGKLVYKTTPAGDRIMDFSFAGYGGGGVTLPEVAVKRTVKPSRKDDTAAIQSAIDEVSKLPLDNGFRGAVELSPGDFTCASTLFLRADGVVLRGSGSTLAGGAATTIHMTGGKHEAIVIGASRGRRDEADARDVGTPTTISDAYVPEGATSFTVADARGLAVGDTIAIRRPTTPAWVHFMQMDNMTRDGKRQTWIAGSRSEIAERKITAISGNKLTVDVPLPDSYDAKYLNPPGTSVAKIAPADVVNHVGVEHLHIQCPPLEIDYGHAPYSAIRVGGDDCWVRDVYCQETMNATTLAGNRITMEQVVVTHTYANLGASKPSDFSIEGSQILIDRCKVTGDNEYFVWTSSLEPGPNVVLNSTFNGRGSRIQPHQRWSTALLVDNCRVPDGGIDFMNRGVAGSGHGWTMGWAVAWNCLAKTYVIQNPPGAANWAIGCIGDRVQTARLFDTAPILPEGIFDSHGSPVAPRSLYLAQLADRLGPGALRAIGYDSADDSALTKEPITHLSPFPSDVDPVLGRDLAIHRPVNTTSVRGNTREFGGEKAIDADPGTYWAASDDADQPAIEIDTEGPLDINAVVLEEPDGLHHVQAYRVEGQVDSDWKLLAEGSTIGSHQVKRFPKTTVWKVRVTILKSNGYPALRKIGLYLAPSEPQPK